MIKEDGTVVFEGKEQEEVNRVVQERLAREREKYSDYEDLKGIDEELVAFGYKGTAKERREALKAQREAHARETELNELKQKAEQSGTSPELLEEIRLARKEAKEANEKLAKIEAERQAKETEINNKKQADEAWNKQVKEFTEAYGDVDLDELAINPKFVKFVKGKSLPLKELYEDFIEFIGDTEAEAIVKMKSKEVRSTGSGKAAGSEGGNYGLTPSQQALCKKNNMSYKEYAEILKNVQ